MIWDVGTCFETIFYLPGLFFTSAHSKHKQRKGWIVTCSVAQMAWTRISWPFMKVILKTCITIPNFWSRQSKENTRKNIEVVSLLDSEFNGGAGWLCVAIPRNPHTWSHLPCFQGRSMKTDGAVVPWDPWGGRLSSHGSGNGQDHLYLNAQHRYLLLISPSEMA